MDDLQNCLKCGGWNIKRMFNSPCGTFFKVCTGGLYRSVFLLLFTTNGWDKYEAKQSEIPRSHRFELACHHTLDIKIL